MQSLKFPETEAITIGFGSLGYDTTLYMLNMGSLIYIYLLFPIISCLAYLIQLVSSTCPRVRTRSQQIIKSIFFNSLIEFTEDTYMILVICCFINYWQVIHNDNSTDINFWLAVLTLLIVIGHPVFVLVVFIDFKIDT